MQACRSLRCSTKCVLHEYRHRHCHHTPRRGLKLAAEASCEAGRGYIASRRCREVDIEVVVEPRNAREAVNKQARRRIDAKFHSRIDNPVRCSTEELPARESMVDGLVEIVERRERTNDAAVVPWPAVVAADNSNPGRIARVRELVRDHAGRRERFSCPYAAKVFQSPNAEPWPSPSSAG